MNPFTALKKPSPFHFTYLFIYFSLILSTLHFISFRYSCLQLISLHFTFYLFVYFSLIVSTLHFTSFRYSCLQLISFHFTSLFIYLFIFHLSYQHHFTSLCCYSYLQLISRHFTSLTSLHFLLFITFTSPHWFPLLSEEQRTDPTVDIFSFAVEGN